jgi:hypothetical protein
MKKYFCMVLLFISWLGVANSQPQPEKPSFAKEPRSGVLLLAHGGHVQTWNEEVRHVADQVDLFIPTEVAFGMASKSTMQEGINRLIARGVTNIVAVPLFVSSHSSVIDSSAYLLGLRAQAPAELRDFAAMDHAMRHGNMAHDSSLNHQAVATNNPAATADQLKPITSSVPIRMTSALDHDEIVGDILTDRAASISTDPSHEVVVLVAHGPVSEDDNKLWLDDMNLIANQMRKHVFYAGIACITLRDDADDPVRNAATQQLRQLVKSIRQAGDTPLVVPLLLSYGGIETGLRKRLAGLDFKMPTEALLPDARIATWVLAQVKASHTNSHNQGQL